MFYTYIYIYKTFNMYVHIVIKFITEKYIQYADMTRAWEIDFML